MSKIWKTDELLSSENFNAIEEEVAEINDEYVPYEWKAGDVITASRLNAIEQGIANASGDSDYSTAEVTFVCESTGFEQGFWGAWAYDDGEHSSIQNYLFSESSTTTATVVLYKGKSVISPEDNKVIEAMSATGNAEVNSKSFDVFITGDCTITYSVIEP